MPLQIKHEERKRGTDMKKVLAVLLIVIVMLSFAGCGVKKDNTSPEEGTQEKDSYVIGFSNRLDSDPWMITFKNRLMELDEENDAFEMLYADANGNDQKQVEQIDNFFVQGIDALIIIPNNGAAVVDSVKQANERGIPVAAISTAPNEGEYIFVGCSHYDTGFSQGEYCAEVLPEGARVLYLGGNSSFQISVDRKQGFKDGLGDRADDLEILSEQECDYTMDNGMTIMEDWIQTFPEFDAVVCVNDQSALGAIEALKGANKLDGKVVCGIDCLDIAAESVKNGELSMTVLQDPGLHADKCMEALLKVLDGGTSEDTITIPVTVVTKDNVNDL